MYHIGDYVRLVPECSTEAEQRLVFMVVAADNEAVTIVCINPIKITPAERVTFNMIESLF